MQETLLLAWEKIDILMEHPNRAGWLQSAANYKIREYKRRERTRPLLERSDECADKGRYDLGYSMCELEMLVEVCLNETERLRFRRHYVMGYSVKKLAALEGVTENAMRVRLYRIRQKLSK